MQTKILKNAGLTDVQAEIYAFLLENGENKASDIAKKTKRPRGVVYKGLDDLLLLKLIEKIENKGITRFRAEHPGNLEKVMEEKEKQIKQELNNKKNRLEIEKKSVLTALPDLVSAFNLTSGKPGIKYYEGIEGVKKVLTDTLKAKEIIYTISDSKSIKENAEKLNKEYIKKRRELGIKKKLIVPQSAKNQYQNTKSEFTEIRFLKDKYFNFDTGIQIYDNKVSYQTIEPDNMIGILIEDKNIYTMQKNLFEYIWDTLAEKH